MCRNQTSYEQLVFYLSLVNLSNDVQKNVTEIQSYIFIEREIRRADRKRREKSSVVRRKARHAR